MTAPLPSGNRHLVPRWRSPLDAVRAGEVGTPTRMATWSDHPTDYELRKRAAEAEQAVLEGLPTLEPGFELLAAALAARHRGLVAHAVDMLSDDAPDIRGMVAALDAASRPNIDGNEPPALVVGQARRRLRRQPRQPLAWLELARGRILLGEEVAATRALAAARQLAPDSRLVLRAQARLLVHLNEHEAAHDLLLGHGRLQEDPWLRATEIAVAQLAGRQPRTARSSRTGLLAADWPPEQASELAAAVSTAEYLAGRSRGARHLLALAVQGKHDNALAQAEWLDHAGLHLHGQDLKAAIAEHTFGFEARARHYYYESAWTSAYEEAQGWQADQGFATLPARFLSLVAVVGLADAEASRKAARHGLAVNPEHPVLLNNAAFASLILGDLRSATTDLTRGFRALRRGGPSSDRAALLATSGLLLYRTGEHRAGMELYRAAAKVAARSEETRLVDAVHLYHYWVRSEMALELGQLPNPERIRFDDPALNAMRQRVQDRSLHLQPVHEELTEGELLTVRRTLSDSS